MDKETFKMFDACQDMNIDDFKQYLNNYNGTANLNVVYQLILLKNESDSVFLFCNVD